MKRGRPSNAALALMAPAPVETVERQRPPHELTDEEVEVWAAVVDSLPADWFTRSNVPLLGQYCRHVVQGKRIAELIEKATSDIDPGTKRPTLTIDDYDRLLRMQERESRTMTTLATKMRITPHSLSNHRGNKIQTPARKPWQG